MRIEAVDFETHLIESGNLTPRLVCGAFFDGEREVLLDRKGTRARLEYLLLCKDVVIVTHNGAFDWGVAMNEWPELTALIFLAHEDGRVSDTLLRQKIIENAAGSLGRLGGYSLAACALRQLDTTIEKEDTWRLRYAELDGVPLSQWPAEAIEYPKKDVTTTLALWHSQYDQILPEELTECRAAFALQLTAAAGLHTEGARVEALKTELLDRIDELNDIVLAYQFVRPVKGKLSRDMKKIKAAVAEYYPGTAPKTKGGTVSTAREVLEKCNHSGLQALAERSGVEKLLSTYIPVLEQGIEAAICNSFDSIKESYRTSYYRPNWQNLPRKGGIRECVVSRAKNTFLFCDYDTGELRALAQVLLDLFGWSKMAEALKEGKDLHLVMAAEILEVSYDVALARYEAGDTEVEDVRQLCKIANFGYPGGMGAWSFIDYAAGYGVVISKSKAEHLRGVFMATFPEMRLYFDWCSNQLRGGHADATFVGTGYRRGDVTYCQLANGNFQHLLAMGAKHALWLVAKACFVGNGPLRGSVPVLFLHDEIATRTPDSKVEGASLELERLMKVGMEKYVKDVPVGCTPVAMKRWYKGAKPVFSDGENGKLVPCRPEKKGGKTVWVRDLSP